MKAFPSLKGLIEMFRSQISGMAVNNDADESVCTLRREDKRKFIASYTVAELREEHRYVERLVQSPLLYVIHRGGLLQMRATQRCLTLAFEDELTRMGFDVSQVLPKEL